jgi:cytochrome oxidase Cu insertion factor (SCO1/SenC/PrrC family)
MDHTAGIYLVRRDGTFVTLMSYLTPIQDATQQLRNLVHS